MTFMEYVNNPVIVKTRSKTEFLIPSIKEETGINEDIIHSILGIYTEFVELVEGLYINDEINIKEEIGDICWYVALGFSTLNINPKIFSEIEVNFETVLSEILVWIDKVKRTLFYKEKFDIKKFEKFLQKVQFVTEIITNELFENEISYSDILELNIKKLAKRYPDGFSEEKALKRDLDKERKILEE